MCEAQIRAGVGCKTGRSNLMFTFCDMSMTNAPPVPVPLLHRCYSCNLWVQAAQVSLSLVIVDLSHIEEPQLNTAYLPEGAITHC